jgi:hypothetical protein
MYQVWFVDLERAIAALLEKTGASLFSSISGNVFGDFVFQMDKETTYLVKHSDFSVLKLVGDWRKGEWVEIK